MFKSFFTKLFSRLQETEPEIEDPFIVDDLFYGKEEITKKDKIAIVRLIRMEAFRNYEKYMRVKQRAKGKRLLNCEDKYTEGLKSDVKLIAEISADHQRFWNEVNTKKEVVVEKKAVKLFGSEKITL